MPHTLPRVAAVALLLATLVPAHASDEPRIRSVKPAGAARGEAVDVVVEGNNLHPVEEVSVDRNDVVVTAAPVGNSATRLLLKVTIAETAPAGPLKIVVRTKTGVATTEKFAVRLRTPTVAKVVPGTLARGRAHDVVVSGTHLSVPAAETKLAVPPPMTFEKSQKSTATSLLLKIVVPPETPVGAHAVTIETPDGKVSAPFAVAFSPPRVTGIEPKTLARGSEATLKIAGESLLGASVLLAVPDAALALAPAEGGDASTLPLRLRVAPEGRPGPRTLLVTTLDGTASATVDVVDDPPSLSRVAPSGAARGTTVDLEVEGKGIAKNAVPRFVPPDPALRVEPGIGGRAPRLSIDASATPGPRTLLVATPQGTVVGSFQVTLRPPHVASLSPSEVAAGVPVEVAVEGQNLAGCSWSVAPPDPSVVVEAVGADRLRVSASADARPGPRCLVARNADGAAIGILAVAGSAPSAPVISGVSPGKVSRPGKVAVAMKGLNLLRAGGGPANVAVTGPGGASIPPEVSSATASGFTVVLPLTEEVPPGTYVVTADTGEGGAAAVVVVVPSIPSIASASPARLSRPADAKVTLAGTAFVGPDGKPAKVEVSTADGSRKIPVTVEETKPESIRLLLKLAADLPTGDLVATASTAEGGTAVVIPVDPAPPAIESIAPARIGVPATSDLQMKGRNLLNPDGKPPHVAVTRAGSASALKPLVVSAAADTLTVRISTPPGTPAGPHVLTVRTADGTAAALFEVVDVPAPVVASIERNAAEAGGTLLTRILGTGFREVTAVTFVGTGVTAVVLPGGTDVELPVKVTVEAGATKGPRTFTVTAAGGTASSGKVVFTVR